MFSESGEDHLVLPLCWYCCFSRLMLVIHRSDLALVWSCVLSVCTVLSCGQGGSPPAQTTPLTIMTSSLTSGLVGSSYSPQAIQATGGSGTGYGWTVTGGTLPPGLSLSNGTPSGTLTGTPTTAGLFSFTVQVQDSQGQRATRSLSLEVIAPPPTTPLTFYVSPTGLDSNPGTLSAPWRTIGKAASTLVAGQTAILMDGTYEEGEIQFRNDGISTQPITIKAEHKHQAILSSTSGCFTNISIFSSYVTIEGIVFRISPLNPQCLLSNPKFNTATGSAVRCWDAQPKDPPVPLPSPANPSTESRGCTVRGVLVEANPQRIIGIKTNQDFSLIEDNEVHSSIEAFNNFGTVFRNNFVDTGDEFGDRMYGKGGVRNLQIYNNEVHVIAGGRGLFVGGNGGAPFGYDAVNHYEAFNSVAYNNVVVVDGGGQAEALGMVGAKDSALYNNIVIGGGIFFSQGGQAPFPPPPQLSPKNPTIKNNIISCGGGAATSGLADVEGVDLDYNVFFNCSGTLPPQVHSIVGDPLFVNPLSDWHLQNGSSALLSGVVLAPFPGFIMPGSIDVSKNKDGITRTGLWNLGIY